MRRLALALTAVAALKCVILWELRDHVLLQAAANPDSEAYVQLARQVVAGNWSLGPGAYFVSPLYIYFLAIVLGITDSFTAVRLAQVLLGTAAVGLMWWTTREWFGERAAWLSGIVATMTGLLTFYEISLLQASVDVALTAGGLAALTAGLTRARSSWFAIAGLVFGIQMLNRPNIVIAVAVVGLALLITRKFKHAALFSVGLLALLLLPSHGGLNFYIGNAPEANGLYRAIPGIRSNILGQAVDAKQVAETAAKRPLTDSEVSQHFTGLAVSWIKAEPQAWARLLLQKVYYTLHGQHIALPLSYPFFAYDTGASLRFLAMAPWLLIPLGLAGLWWGQPSVRRAEYLVWLAFVPGAVASVALFFVSERYRLPLLVPLVVGSGAALSHLATMVTTRAWSRLTLSTAALAIGVVALNQPLDMIDGDGRMEERVKMAEAMARLDRADDAERWIADSSPVYPYPDVAHHRLGVAYASRQQWARATPHFARAMELSPTNPGYVVAYLDALVRSGQVEGADKALAALVALPADAAPTDVWLRGGRLAIQSRQVDAAVRLFQRAVDRVPQMTAARDQLGIALLMAERYEDARVQFEVVVNREPANADAWAHLALIALQQNKPGLVRQYAGTALTLSPQHPMATQVLAAVR